MRCVGESWQVAWPSRVVQPPHSVPTTPLTWRSEAGDFNFHARHLRRLGSNPRTRSNVGWDYPAPSLILSSHAIHTLCFALPLSFQVVVLDMNFLRCNHDPQILCRKPISERPTISFVFVTTLFFGRPEVPSFVSNTNGFFNDPRPLFRVQLGCRSTVLQEIMDLDYFNNMKGRRFLCNGNVMSPKQLIITHCCEFNNSVFVTWAHLYQTHQLNYLSQSPANYTDSRTVYLFIANMPSK